MKRFLAVLLGLPLGATLVLAPQVLAQATQPPQTSTQAERWLHVRVESREGKGEMVRVNVPLSLAEKVLPTIQSNRLRNGRVTIDRAHVHGVDLRTLLDAVRTARDGEYVTVQGTSGEVRVAKQAGYLLVHAREDKDAGAQRVEVRVPMTVVEALLSAGSNELDLVAAIRALAAHGDAELVTAKDEHSTVRIWVDTKGTSE